MKRKAPEHKLQPAPPPPPNPRLGRAPQSPNLTSGQRKAHPEDGTSLTKSSLPTRHCHKTSPTSPGKRPWSAPTVVELEMLAAVTASGKYVYDKENNFYRPS